MTPSSLLPIMVVLAFALSFSIAEVIRRHSVRLQLVQIPNHRSSHAKPTASGGGVGIAVAGTAFGILLAQGAPLAFQIAVAVAGIGATIGFLDDRFDLSPILRIVFHFGLVATLLLSTSVVPLADLQVWSGWSILAFGGLLVLGVWWINLFNFMDGIDGIAASEAVYILAAAATFLIGNTTDAAWIVLSIFATVIGACLGFLILNWPPARIFMGDAGSNYLAFFILAAALITVAAGGMRLSVWAILPAVFVADATVTLLRRAVHGERWFSAHRLHAYQKLSRRWKSHRLSTLLYIAINVLWLYPLAYWADSQPTYEWLIAVLAYIPLLLFCWIAGAGRPEPTTGHT